MSNRFSHILFFLIISFPGCLSSCQEGSVHDNAPDILNSERIVNSYAKGFLISEFPGYKELAVLDPQDSTVILARYSLFGKDNKHAKEYSETEFQLPLSSFACFSTTQTAMFSALNSRDLIKGMAESEYIYDPLLRNMLDEKAIANIGRSGSMDLELIIDLQPQACLVYESGVPSYDKGRKLDEAGLNTILIQEFRETHPLAQAEWIKVYGLLIGKDSLASEIFEHVRKEYESLQMQAALKSSLPVVFTGMAYQGNWTVPGGKSFPAAYLGDAGAGYVFGSENSTGSFLVDIETMIDEAGDAEFWLNPGNASSLDEVITTDSRYNLFEAYRNKKLYNCIARKNEFGGNDYWESGIVNPHLVLADLIHIFHPDINPEHSLYYYQKLDQ